jgi:hypothetical protein
LIEGSKAKGSLKSLFEACLSRQCSPTVVPIKPTPEPLLLEVSLLAALLAVSLLAAPEPLLLAVQPLASRRPLGLGEAVLVSTGESIPEDA